MQGMILRSSDSPVEVKILKAEDVQNSDRFANVTRVPVDPVNGKVDFVNEPDKHASIHAFHQCVPHVHCGLGVERF